MDRATRSRLGERLRGVVGPEFAFVDPYEVRLYQYDASPETALPDAVVIPGSAAEVAAVLRICAEEEMPVVSRSGATSLAGGTVPVEGGVVITFARMDRILAIDMDNLRALLEPGRLHHRRQRRHQRRRPAHPPLRCHRQPRDGTGGCAAQRRARPGRTEA